MANLKYTQFHCLKATKNSSFSHIQIYPSSISISNFLPPYIHTQVQDHSKALIKMKPNNLQWPLGYILRRNFLSPQIPSLIQLFIGSCLWLWNRYHTNKHYKSNSQSQLNSSITFSISVWIRVWIHRWSHRVASAFRITPVFIIFIFFLLTNYTCKIMV